LARLKLADLPMAADAVAKVAGLNALQAARARPASRRRLAKSAAEGSGSAAHRWVREPAYSCWKPDPLDEEDVPLDPQARTNARAAEYKSIWECLPPGVGAAAGARMDFAPQVASGEPELPRLTPKVLRKAARSFRVGRAVSLDNLRPRHAALLSDSALRALASLFYAFERLGGVAGVLVNMVAFIPKDAGGERAIGILVAIYALSV